MFTQQHYLSVLWELNLLREAEAQISYVLPGKTGVHGVGPGQNGARGRERSALPGRTKAGLMEERFVLSLKKQGQEGTFCRERAGSWCGTYRASGPVWLKGDGGGRSGLGKGWAMHRGQGRAQSQAYCRKEGLGGRGKPEGPLRGAGTGLSPEGARDCAA